MGKKYEPGARVEVVANILGDPEYSERYIGATGVIKDIGPEMGLTEFGIYEKAEELDYSKTYSTMLVKLDDHTFMGGEMIFAVDELEVVD